jgi:arylsulfatase A-like enzyme
MAPGLHKAITHLDGGSIDVYRTMIRHMDEGIGRILETLDRTGVAEDTLVVFTSDNGGERFSDNWPLVGGKMDLLEGGIRVPYIARWPRRIPAGRTTAQLAITMDWVTTFLEAAGVAPDPGHPLDGLSLIPVLEAPERTIPRELYWRMKYRDQKAMRAGRFKYLALEGHEFLFDLEADARERANLAGREADRLAEMRRAYQAWDATMPPIPPDAVVSIPYDRRTMALP